MTLLTRDPFARTELHKSRIAPVDVSYAALSCDWCGQTGRGGALYRFQTESDGGRVSRHPGRFCSASCFRSYHS